MRTQRAMIGALGPSGVVFLSGPLDNNNSNSDDDCCCTVQLAMVQSTICLILINRFGALGVTRSAQRMICCLKRSDSRNRITLWCLLSLDCRGLQFPLAFISSCQFLSALHSNHAAGCCGSNGGQWCWLSCLRANLWDKLSPFIISDCLCRFKRAIIVLAVH